LTFDYRIVGKRRGFETQRLTDVTERFNTERAHAMPVSNAAVSRTTLQPHPAITSPGMPLAPGSHGVVHQLPQTHPAPIKVGAGGLQAMNHRSKVQ